MYSVAFQSGRQDACLGERGQDDQAVGRGDGQGAGHPQGTHGRCMSVAFSPDGKTLASGSVDRTIKLWDVATGKELATLTRSTLPRVYSVAFSPDGKTLASGSWDNTIKLWDVATGKEQATLKGHNGDVCSVAFSPDGKTLASGSWDDDDQAVGRGDGQGTGHPQGAHVSMWTSVAFSPDGKTLASGSGDETIKLWDVETGKEQATVKGHTERVCSVAFSPNGKTLASGSLDKTIKLWDIRSTQDRTARAVARQRHKSNPTTNKNRKAGSQSRASGEGGLE